MKMESMSINIHKCVSYYSVWGRDNSLRAVIRRQLGPSLDTVRLLQGRSRDSNRIFRQHNTS